MKTANTLMALTAIGLAAPAFAQIAAPSTGNGGLLFIGYDDVAKHSLIEYLGLPSSLAQPGNIDANVPASGDFALAGYSAAFTGSTAGNIHWMVVGGDSTTTGSGNPNYNGTSLLTTASQDPNGVQNNAGVKAGLLNLNNMVGFANQGCSNAPSCVALSSTDGQYAGVLGTNLNNPTDPTAPSITFTNTGGVGDSLAFYLFTGIGSGAQSSQTILSPTLYAGTFSLNNGTLHWASTNAVPLPAAAWLLVSGLAGMFSVGRRRTAVAA